MTTATNLIISFIIFSTGLLFLVIGFLAALPFVPYIGFFLLAFLFTLLIVNQRIVVPEHAVFIVTDMYHQRYSRLLKPGIHWLYPHELVDEEISLMPISASGIIKQLRTLDGIVFSASYDVTIVPTPDTIPEDIKPMMVRILPKYLKDLANGRVEEILREIVGKSLASELVNGRFLSVLKGEFNAAFTTKMEGLGIGVYRTVINELTPPAEYTTSVINQHVRENEARAQAVVIELLRDSLRGVPNADKHLIAELEKLRTVAGGKGSVIYAPRASQPIEPDHIEEPALPWEAIFRPRDDEDSHISA